MKKNSRIWIQDPDPDPLVRGMDPGSGSGSTPKCHGSGTLVGPQQPIFSACYFLKVHLYYFSKIKSQKESQNRKIQGFTYHFCMMIEGSVSRAGSRSIPLTSGSWSGRPKNTWIRWIRIWNTGSDGKSDWSAVQEGWAVDRISPKLEPPISIPLSRPSSKQQNTTTN